jgi:hypothetical protein
MSTMGAHCGPRTRSASVQVDENAASGFDAARGWPGRRRPPAARSSLLNACLNFGELSIAISAQEVIDQVDS